MHESELIRAIGGLLKPLPAGMVGMGDDCCVWQSGPTTCLSVDSIVEDRDFTRVDPPGLIGGKAAGGALSDLAAMGARPVGAVAALVCPARWDALEIMKGVVETLDRHGCPLLGGDTSGGDALVLAITVWGEPGAGRRLLYRSGGRPGDLLIVTGPLGGSLASGRHLRPEPRLEEGCYLAALSAVSAMIDISDGLASDAPRLAEASGCGCLLLPGQVPVHPDVPEASDTARAACCDGEDFELLFALAAERWPDVQLAWPFPRPLSVVGWLIEQPGAFIEDHQGRVVPLPWRGFEHH